MEKDTSSAESQEHQETEAYRLRRNQLVEYIRDKVIQVKELRSKAQKAEDSAGRKIQEAMQKGYEGEKFRGDYILNPSQKGMIVLQDLSKEIQDQVFAHGVASNRPTTDRDFPINALISILATGIVKGDNTLLSGGLNQVVFTDAPFILLSNKGEQLTEEDTKGEQRLKNLRTVLVNGQYEGIVEDLRKAFPGVSFRTAEQIEDAVFDKKGAPYVSYEDKIRDQIKKETTGK